MEALLVPEQLEELKKKKILVFNQDASEMKGAEIIKTLAPYKVKEVDSFVSGLIRVFDIQNSKGSLLVVQEWTTKTELVLRVFESLDEVEKFLQARRDICEQLWESGCCGGKSSLKTYYLSFPWEY